MKRIVWLCANEFRTHDAAAQGIWHYLRQATHNPSPSPYTIEHIPTLAKELSRVYAIAASIGDLHRAIDAEAIRSIFRHGKEAEPVIRHLIDKAQQHASGQERTMQELLPTWAKDDLGDFAKRKPCLSLGLHEHQAEQPGFFRHHA